MHRIIQKMIEYLTTMFGNLNWKNENGFVNNNREHSRLYA